MIYIIIISLVLMAFLVLRALYRLLRMLYIYDTLHVFHLYRRGSRFISYRYTTDGSKPWAFITNVGNGLGMTFALTLADAGFNLVLHDASLYNVNQLQEVLMDEYPSREFRTVVADPEYCFEDNYESYPDIQETVHDISIKILINNVGPLPKSAENVPKTISNSDPRQLSNIMGKWILFPTHILSTLTPRLAGCGPSVIVNVEAPKERGAQYTPLHASCNHYLRTLTEELACEMKLQGKKVEVMDIVSGSIAGVGEDEDDLDTIFGQSTVVKFVGAVLMRIGCGETVIAPYLLHAVTEWLMGLLPERLQGALLFISTAVKEIYRLGESVARFVVDAGTY